MINVYVLHLSISIRMVNVFAHLLIQKQINQPAHVLLLTSLQMVNVFVLHHTCKMEINVNALLHLLLVEDNVYVLHLSILITMVNVFAHLLIQEQINQHAHVLLLTSLQMVNVFVLHHLYKMEISANVLLHLLLLEDNVFVLHLSNLITMVNVFALLLIQEQIKGLAHVLLLTSLQMVNVFVLHHLYKMEISANVLKITLPISLLVSVILLTSYLMVNVFLKVPNKIVMELQVVLCQEKTILLDKQFVFVLILNIQLYIKKILLLVQFYNLNIYQVVIHLMLILLYALLDKYGIQFKNHVFQVNVILHATVNTQMENVKVVLSAEGAGNLIWRLWLKTTIVYVILLNIVRRKDFLGNVNLLKISKLFLNVTGNYSTKSQIWQQYQTVVSQLILILKLPLQKIQLITNGDKSLMQTLNHNVRNNYKQNYKFQALVMETMLNQINIHNMQPMYPKFKQNQKFLLLRFINQPQSNQLKKEIFTKDYVWPFNSLTHQQLLDCINSK
ncbi:hypothetical protein IMG5_122470 [Ichthyophthirius multifiliis]|uniref:Transmembrane protein n=1 Tax=Ichthyophthirius multifiliis TaxID=5932 RepID=G0QVA2_ICHMU|nr:hypothetical protein IMG5_122470 [Ichthyophthirius multifiliis]EGR30846.1 hypothetical protein IMG5_122470 [Ichthyophthirius multifiliis]|eukprot:XP_004032433.1 hypothetical protein IMG5_122470 [Ichthyophthirius multifiliis]